MNMKSVAYKPVNNYLARRARYRVFCLGILLAVSSTVQGAPQGGEITSGSGQIQAPDAQTTIVTQESPTLSINWESLNLNSDELLQFNQPNQQSISLNHILDQNPSQIHGRIDANGRVFLMNPNGVIFGESARINVGGLFAGAFQMDSERLDSLENSPDYILNIGEGRVENNGSITVTEGGSVALLGNTVVNNGTIEARLGKVHLLSADQASMSFDQDGMIQFAITKESISNDSEGDSAIENAGTLQADGGYVVMEAQAANDVFVNVVNNSGVIRANRISNEGGVIRLEGTGGAVVNTGEINASGDQGSSGGTISLLGDHVGVFDGSVINASGEQGGGNIYIGGQLRGTGEHTAEFTQIGRNVSIQADAIVEGDGGEVIVWANDSTWALGDLSAKGGEQSGNGGFIEISGKQGLVMDANINLKAENGHDGTLLIDPANIIIFDQATSDDSGDAFLPEILTAEGAGTLNLDEDTLEAIAGGANIILEASDNITINDLTDNSLNLQTGVGNSVTITADSNADGVGNFAMNRSDSIATLDGSVTISGADVTVGTFSTGAGAVTLSGTSTGTLTGPNSDSPWIIDSLNSGSIDINAGAGTVSFSSFSNLVGGSGVDTFTVDGIGSLTGQIDGGAGGSDTVNYSTASIVGSVTINTDVINIEGLTGGTAYYTLNGDNGNNTWTIDDVNDGDVAGISFTDFRILNGGTGNDSFILDTLGAEITGAIDGGAGAGVDSLTARDAANTWFINALNAGSLTNVFSFNEIENLTGGGGVDAFSLINASAEISGTIDGGGDSDSLAARNTANDWDINGLDTGTVTGVGLLFQNMENLIGNNDTDTFTFSDPTSSITGTINGGGGLNDSVDLSILAAVTVDLSTTDYANIEEFTGNDSSSTLIGANQSNTWTLIDTFDGINDGTLGSTITFIDFTDLTGGGVDDVFILDGGTLTGVINGGVGDDELVADNNANTWLLNSGTANSGDVDGIGSFSNIENLTGNILVDEFQFSNGASFTGTIDGGVGADIVDYSGEAAAVSVSIGATGFLNIETFTGNDIDSTIIGGSNDNNWVISGENDGQITDTVTLAVIDFENFNNIAGGANADQFTLAGGNIAGTLDGGAGTNTLFAESIAAINSTWNINNSDAGQVTGVTGSTAFSNIESLIGNPQDDSFIFGLNGTISGTINAASGTDNIDYSAKVAVPVSVDLNSGNFISIENYTGNNTDSTLIGINAVTLWDITGENDFSINTQNFTDFNHLVGNDSDDTFDIAPAGDILGSITGGGGAGVDSIEGKDSGVTWNITGVDVGNATGVAAFSGIETLQGGTGVDSFDFAAPGIFNGTIDGGAGLSIDEVDLSLLPDPVIVDLEGTSYADIESFIGNGSDSTLIGQNAANTWTIDGVNSGDVNGIAFTDFTDLTGNIQQDDFTFGLAGTLSGNIDGAANDDSLTAKDAINDWIINNPDAGSLTDVGGFSSIENIIGGSEVDTFEYVSSGSISGSVDGMDGIDVADLQTQATVNVVLGSGSSGITNVETFIGNNVDSTLVGILANNIWTINGENDGSVFDGSDTVNFVDFNFLTGNSSSDIFQFQYDGVTTFGAITNGQINGGDVELLDIVDFSAVTVGVVDADLSGTDYANIETFNGSNTVTSTLIGANTANDWDITGDGDGTLDDGVNIIAFNDFDNLTGGTAVDNFTLDFFGSIGQIDGGNVAGDDNLTAANDANNWLITGIDSGSLDSGSLTGIGGFVNIENLTGNNNTDDFVFNSGSSITGSVDGSNGTDSVDQSLQAGLVNIVLGSTGYINIEDFTGNGINSTLTADNVNNSWTINGIDDGVVGTVNFTDVGNLQGGTGDDSFSVVSGGFLNGQLDGGAGGGADSITGPNATNTWDISAPDIGKLTSGADGVFQFSDIETLTGNSGVDSFIFADGSSFAGNIDGGANADTLSVASQTSNTTVSLAAGQYTNIETFIGNAATANSTLVGESNINAWSITGTDAGIIDGVINFSGFNNLQGNASADTFTLQSGGSITVSVDGGSGTDTIEAFNISNTWNITSPDSGNVNGIASFQNIDNLQGNASVDTYNLNANLTGYANGGGGNDIFNVNGAITVNGSIIGGVGVDTLNGPNIDSTWNVSDSNTGIMNSINFAQVENLSGGTGIDTFSITNAATADITGVIDGGSGDDVLNVDYTAASTRTITFNGGLGSDDISLTGSGPSLVNSYVFGPTPDDVTITTTSGVQTQTVIATEIENIADSITADTIALVASSFDDAISLAPGGIGTIMTSPSLLPLEFSNKTNFSLDTGFGNDSISIDGAIVFPGDVTLTTEALIQGASGSITASNLILNNVGTTGTSGSRLQTNISNLQVNGTTSDVYITEQNGLSVAAANVTNVFDISSIAGDITSSGDVVVSGSSRFNVGNLGSIILDSANNQFAGTPVFTSAGVINNLTVVDNSGIDLPTLTIAGDLNITANGITQSGPLSIQGNSSFSGGSNVISLGNSLNDFVGTVSLQNSGNNNVALSDQNNLTIGTSSIGSGTLTVNAGSINQSGPFVQQANAGATRFTANTGSLILDNTGNDFTGVVSLINNSSSNTVITESNHLLLGSSTTSGGDLTATVDNGITLSGTTVSNNGDITVTANTGNIQLGRLNAGTGKIRLEAVTGDVYGNNSPIPDPNLTSQDLEIIAGGHIGDFNNPISVNVALDGTSFFDTGIGSAHIIGFPGTILGGSALVNDVSFTSLAISKGQSVAYVPTDQFLGADYFLLPLYTFVDGGVQWPDYTREDEDLERFFKN